ncbi:MAG: putative toxin-antitoxin system toxin component, PIN family [Syntrophaceae bacterium]|nr:putative toxin-antitoxin system toxin component, PIN family [Syntrophaceae bacterium]
MLRVVLDTNILISAILFGGKPRQVLEKAIRGEIQLCISEPILDELRGVLGRAKFDYPLEAIQVILAELLAISDFVNPSKRIPLVFEDPEDNRILECAVEAGANYIITGDIHLLKLGRYENIRIRNAGGFLEESSS